MSGFCQNINYDSEREGWLYTGQLEKTGGVSYSKWMGWNYLFSGVWSLRDRFHIQSYIIHIPGTQTTLGLIGKDLSDFDGPAETIQTREGCESRPTPHISGTIPVPGWPKLRDAQRLLLPEVQIRDEDGDTFFWSDGLESIALKCFLHDTPLVKEGRWSSSLWTAPTRPASWDSWRCRSQRLR